MGVSYHYVNRARREHFAASALGGGDKRAALGRTLAARAFHLMLLPDHPAGRWAGDPITLLGDSDPGWNEIRDHYTDVRAHAIRAVFEEDGFAPLGEAAATSDGLFMSLAHLALTRQLPALDDGLRAAFGADYPKHYARLCDTRPWFRPADLPPDAA